MGYKVTTPVWDYSKAKGSTFTVLLAIADSADNTTGDAYPSIETLASMARLSIRATQYAIRHLEKIGELSVLPRTGQRTSVYHVVLFDGLVFDRETGAKIAPVRGAKIAPVVVQGFAPDRCKPASKGVQSTTNAIERARDTLEPVLNQQSLSPVERELCIKDLRRIFPSISSVPEQIPTSRAFLFWYKVRIGDIRPNEIKNPVAYMVKMMDEDIDALMLNDGKRIMKLVSALKGVA